MQGPVVSLVTDFGQSEYVASMKAAIWRVCPECRVLDYYHGVAHGRVLQGAHLLVKAVADLPEAVHLVVVDPGVGTDRRAVVATGDGLSLVGPDNGVLEPALRGIDDVVVRDLEAGAPQISEVFHGRDVFAPAAARLAMGEDPDTFSTVGPGLYPLMEYGYDRFGGRIITHVAHVDVFGNVQVPVPKHEAAGFLLGVERLTVWIADQSHEARAVGTYGQLGVGELGVLVSSSGHLEVAVRDGPAAAVLEARIGDEIAFDVP